MKLSSEEVRRLVRMALDEDAPSGDVTSRLCIDAQLMAQARIVAKQPGVVAGTAFADQAFRECGAACQTLVGDGGRVAPGDTIIRIPPSPARAVLLAERVALNFLCHLSGIATAAADLVAAVEGTGAVILDTRKTTPGLRGAEKAAVRAGGGRNHRFGLSDAVLIKENHIRAAGGISSALGRVLAESPVGLSVEVEVRTIAELQEAIASGAPMVLLDNMTPETMKEAAALARAKGVKTEASGNVTPVNVRRIAETGVDYISSGWITHSSPVLDLSLLVEETTD